MYDFHKIKNIKGFHQFRHEKFKRGHPEDLNLIKRKVNDILEGLDNMSSNDKTLHGEFIKLRKSNAQLEDSLKTIHSQNKKLIEVNKNFVGQIYFSKAENELKLRKLMFLLFILVNNYTSEIVSYIKEALDKIGMSLEGTEGEELSLKSLQNFIKTLVSRFTGNSDMSNLYLDKLMEIFIAFLKESNKEKFPNLEVNWEDFVKKIVDKEQPAIANRQIGEENHDKSGLLMDNYSHLDNDSNFFKDSILDLQFNNSYDFDFMGGRSRKLSSMRSISDVEKCPFSLNSPAFTKEDNQDFNDDI
jgi:hypothetical protein